MHQMKFVYSLIDMERTSCLPQWGGIPHLTYQNHKKTRIYILLGMVMMTSRMMVLNALPYMFSNPILLQVGNVSVSCTRIPLLALDYEAPRFASFIILVSAAWF